MKKGNRIVFLTVFYFIWFFALIYVLLKLLG